MEKEAASPRISCGEVSFPLWNVFIIIRYIFFSLHIKLNFAFSIIWQHYLKYVSMGCGFGEVLIDDLQRIKCSQGN